MPTGNYKRQEAIIHNMRYLLTILIGILIIDFLGFIAWIISNQIPPDGFYIGILTANIIKLLI